MQDGERPDEAIRRRAEAISSGPEAGTPLDDWTRAEQEHFVAHYYDTLGSALTRLGMTLARVPQEAGVVWRLTLPRGELVEAWEAGTDGLAPPAEVLALVGGILEGEQLVPESPVNRQPGGTRLREALAAQRQALLAHEPGVRLAAEPDNLRRHRVAARRTRAFLRTTRAYVDPAWAQGLKDLLRELGDATGPVRDLDVAIEHVRRPLEAIDGADRTGADRLLAVLEAERAALQTRLVAALDAEHHRLLLTRLRFPPRFRVGVDDVPLEQLARKEFARLARSVRRLGASPDDAAIHGLRIALKRARYASELAAPRGKAGRRFLEAAKTLQDLLGEHQDALVTEERLRSVTVRDDATAAAFVAGRLAERQGARRARVSAQLPAAWRRLRKRGARL